jgi:hypothetical protein
MLASYEIKQYKIQVISQVSRSLEQMFCHWNPNRQSISFKNWIKTWTSVPTCFLKIQVQVVNKYNFIRKK